MEDASQADSSFLRHRGGWELKSSEELWDDAVKATASQLRGIILREVYAPYLARMHELRTFSDKSVYMFTLVFQPQRFLSIKRVLGFKTENTLAGSMRHLNEGGYLWRDPNQFWWARRIDDSPRETL